jgi:hypothetical protein
MRFLVEGFSNNPGLSFRECQPPQQVRTDLGCLAQGCVPAPAIDGGVIAVEQDLWYGEPPELARPGVVGILKQRFLE